MTHPYIPNSTADHKFVLDTLGLGSFQELLNIPHKFLLKNELDIPEFLCEAELVKHVNALAEQNHNVQNYLSFLGGGAYDHFIPQVVDQLLLRSEFLTAYTPYQPEVSQGTLQTIFEYQTMVARLTSMEVCNASLYDGAMSLVEAIVMAKAIRKREGIVFIPESLNPQYTRVLETYNQVKGINIVTLPYQKDGRIDLKPLAGISKEKCLALVLQQPNFFGVLEDIAQVADSLKEKELLLLVQNDLLSSAILEPPGNFGADIVMGEMHYFGSPPSFGGPFLGYLTSRKKYLRQMPGRIVGLTEDGKGTRGFVLTAQTREQHIRREKATSNVCTNQGLMALAATVHLALLGKEGIQAMAKNTALNAYYAGQKVCEYSGVSRQFTGAFFREFVLKLSKEKESQVKFRAPEENIFPGIWMEKFKQSWKGLLLVCVTEKHQESEINRWLKLFV